MSAAEIVAFLATQGIILEVAGDKLRVMGAGGAPSRHLIERIAARKSELLAYLLEQPPAVPMDFEEAARLAEGCSSTLVALADAGYDRSHLDQLDDELAAGYANLDIGGLTTLLTRLDALYDGLDSDSKVERLPTAISQGNLFGVEHAVPMDARRSRNGQGKAKVTGDGLPKPELVGITAEEQRRWVNQAHLFNIKRFLGPGYRPIKGEMKRTYAERLALARCWYAQMTDGVERVAAAAVFEQVGIAVVAPFASAAEPGAALQR